MTVIVGLVDGDTVYLGGDSAGVAGLSISSRVDEKVFENGPFIFGFTSSFRMGQLLRYKFVAPKQTTEQNDMQYMATDFIDTVRKCFADNGFGERNSGGCFLVGYNGKLYGVDDDFQVGVQKFNFDSVGCGQDIALGAMFSTPNMEPRKRITNALKAACAFSAGVRPPFHIVKQSVAGKKKAKK